jgi:hypothetical protein
MGGNRFLGVFLGTLLVVMAAGGALAWSIHSAGMLTVDIHGKGPGSCDVTGIRIPAAVAHVALALVPDEAFDWAEDEELQRWGPLIHEACQQLLDSPDFTLVEVMDDDEHVFIRKRGKTLVIDVEDRTECVHVTVPLSIAKAFARKIDGRSAFI